MYSLVLTLGHGSSAILIRDDVIINGYQNERITKIKSDSQFPMHAIEEIMKYDDIPENVVIYVSHWEPSGDVNKMSRRHWNPTYIKRRFPNYTLKTLNINFTHHDAHAYSALAYFKNNMEGTHIIVADGFGNYGQVLTIYQVENSIPKPIFSSHNYEASLGLLYQYATDYVGLKMNQDEWKLNAAAANVDKDSIEELTDISRYISSTYIDRLMIYRETDGDPMLELGALSFTHKMVVDLLDEYFDKDNVNDIPKIAFVLQKVVEACIMYLIDYHGIKHVKLVGGVFMNVQLNGYIASQVYSAGAMPLSGDSGAGLGVYKHFNPDFEIPDSLCWGKRRVKGLIHVGIKYTMTLQEDIIKYLRDGYIVNIVTGKMEFGERAYCNTSTIALPTKENSEIINKANGRSSTMPMAPVVDEYLYDTLFFNTKKIVKSVEHMIMALPYNANYVETLNIGGITHFLPEQEMHTGRPQVIKNGHHMSKVINEFGPLINTSFNIHGQPICMSASDILKAHVYQQKNCGDAKFVTLIGVDNE